MAKQEVRIKLKGFDHKVLDQSAQQIVAAVEATGLLLRDGDLGDLVVWLSMIAAFDAVFLVVCPFAFNVVVEE